MQWRAPEVAAPTESFTGGERAMLESFVDKHRTTFVWKCSGLTGEQLARRSMPPSELSLLALVRHVADMERAWFGRYVAGLDLPLAFSGADGQGAAFRFADPARAEEDYRRLVEEWELSRQRAAAHDLDEVFSSERWGHRSLRWVYHHVVEEYARHNGHADLLREAIDGTVGEWVDDP